VASARQAPGRCAATLLDRKAWRANGAITLSAAGDRFVLLAARPPGYERPWAQPAPRSAQSAAGTDATPRRADLEAGD